MTVADNALSVENVAAPSNGRATITTPLPEGWRAFCSKPDPGSSEPGRWYATHLGHWCLARTIHADTWQELHDAIAEQVDRHNAIHG